MPNIFAELRTLRQEGKVHSRLITRVRILIGISLIITVITIYNLIMRPADLLLATALIAIGVMLGMYVFSRMSVVQWDEEASVVSTGRMDVLGFGAIALYIAFELGLRTLLKDSVPESSTTLILAAVSGTIFGRAIGTVIEIHRVYKTSHSL